MKHTPGPWAVTDDKLGVFSANMPLYQNKVIANCGAVARERAENEANARLIAAAPDLLAACQAAIEEQSIGMYGAISNECIAKLRAAIAKATETT